MKDSIVEIIAPGRSVLGLNNNHILENSIIKTDDEEWLKERGFSMPDVEKWRANGTLVKTIMSGGMVSAPPADSVQTAVTVPGASKGAGIDANEAAKDTTVKPPPTRSAPRGKPNSQWGYDPATLQGMNLLELNQLVATNDTSVPAFQTELEAINFLSKDFQGSGDKVS